MGPIEAGLYVRNTIPIVRSQWGKPLRLTKETVMAAMFCTLKEALQRLNATEDELKSMVEQGKLREFRDGLDRLFRIDEVEAIAPQASDTMAEDGLAPQTMESDLSEPDANGVGAALESADAEMDGIELEVSEPEEMGFDAPAFDIRAELGMLDAEEAGAAERSGLGEVVAADLPVEDLTVEEETDVQMQVASQPAPRATRAAPAAYVHVSVPKKSAWRWFADGLRNDRPAAVVLLFVLLGAILSGCAALGYVLHKFL